MKKHKNKTSKHMTNNFVSNNMIINIYLSFLLTLSCLAANAQNTATVIEFENLDAIIKTSNEEVQVINFWATWCAPCIKELPYFEALPGEISGRDLNVTLVSLDFVEKLDKVNSFINRKKLKSNVLLFDNVDYNSWIDKVNENWSGAIPATLIVDSKSGKQKFIEGEVAEGELENIIKALINP